RDAGGRPGMARRVKLGDFSEQRPTRAEVSLDALAANVACIRSHLGGRALLAVVKADAYGHGALPVARCLQQLGVEHLAVALLEEATELREGGVSTPILVVGAVEAAQMGAVLRREVPPALFRFDQLEALEAAAASAGRRTPYHLKVDTGMGRLGVPWRMAGEFLEGATRFRHVELQGVFSHLACADEP